jgi:hypothetical protein
MPPRAKALMNSIHQMDCHPNWNRKISDETRQDDWLFHLINNQIIINPNVFIKSCSLCKKTVLFAK